MKKILIKLGIVFLFLISCVACNFAPGSYPYAEEYEFKCNEPDLISAVEIFKKENPMFCVPQTFGLIDGRSQDSDDHWYHVYFYYSEEKLIIYCWTRQMEESVTNFAFVSIGNSQSVGNWKNVNKDFSSENNKTEKEKFEKRILSKIREIVQRNK